MGETRHKRQCGNVGRCRAMPTTDALAAIQAWYAARCDGDWEHAYGLTIETLDNPGWAIRIDLFGTPDAARSFDQREIRRDENDWLVYEVEGERFTGLRAEEPR